MITQRRHGQHMADRKIALMPLHRESDASRRVAVACVGLMAATVLYFIAQFLR